MYEKALRPLREFVVFRIRFLAGVASGIATWLALPTGLLAAERLLLAWNVGVLLFLILEWAQFLSLPAGRIRHRYEDNQQNAIGMLVAVCLGAMASLAAVVLLLADQQPSSAHAFSPYLVTGVTVLTSWTLVPTVFTAHYADLYYSTPTTARPLAFPEGLTDPDYWDFIYFSFTIAVACQTADVSTRSTAMRRATIAHSILSFFFNAAVLGFAINVAAGVLGSSKG